MNIKDQLCTVEQSRKLVELGVTRDTFLMLEEATGEVVLFDIPPGKQAEHGYLPGYSVAELGALLPHHWGSMKDMRGPTDWFAPFKLSHFNGKPVFLPLARQTEAQARAEMLIWFIKKGEPGFSVAEINKRLEGQTDRS